jgi:hypothetical protein
MTALLAHINSQRERLKEAWRSGFVVGALLGVMATVPIVVAATIAIVRM